MRLFESGKKKKSRKSEYRKPCHKSGSKYLIFYSFFYYNGGNNYYLWIPRKCNF